MVYDFITKYTDILVAKMCEAFAVQKLLTIFQQKILAYFRYILAGDEWWPHAIGSRLHFALAITYLMRHRLGSFGKGKKRIPTKNTSKIICLE